jgi:hypothetical protein
MSNRILEAFMGRMAVVASLSFASACACGVDAGEDPPSRLVLLRTDEHGARIWYDAERGEECQSYPTESSGNRCFPRFTGISAAQLGYRDGECRNLVAWTTLDRPSDRYVAVLSAGGDKIVGSFFGVLKVSESDERYVMASGACVYDKSGDAGTCADITTMLRPQEFAPVYACGLGFVETRLSLSGGPEVFLCRECDYACADGAGPCEAFGRACDFRGKPGVCSTCCNGFAGELRCFPRMD